MVETFANQKVVYVHKGKYKNDFLQLPNDDWRNAGKMLKYGTFKLYLELAGNSDGYRYPLSKVGCETNLGISKNVYYRAVDELIEKGFLVEGNGNLYHFYTVPYKGQNQDDTCPVEGTPDNESCPLQGTNSPVEGTAQNTSSPVEGTPSPVEGTPLSLTRDKLSRRRVENIDKYIINNIDNNGHCVPLETTPSAPSKTLPSVAPAEKKNKYPKPAQRLADICACSVGEMEGIVNDNGLDYHALLRCVENGYINGENLYSKTYWDSMDIDDVLRDPTYAEYLVGMYKSNPNGLDEAKSRSSQSDDNGCDDTLVDATENIDDGNDDDVDMSWLDDMSDWIVA